jgi:ribosomal protein L16 Arg81 hydroxylase
VSLPIYLPGFSNANHVRSLITVESVLESIWIGNRTCIAPHFDNTENLACVVGGRRRFTMFPPDQIGNLYVGPLDFTPAGQPVSLVDVRNPDLARFPRFAEAAEVAEVAELSPGDAVYIPALWWHNVEALEDFNVLVNYWWRDVADYFDSPSMSLLHCLLTVKSLPPEQRRNWKAVFDYLIFQSEGPALEHLPPRVQGLFGELTQARADRLRSMLLKNLSRKST